MLARLSSTVAPSIPGLHLLGRASEGEAICFYPGLLYQPGDISALAGWKNNYFMRLSDGTFLDGRYYGLSRFLWRGAAARCGVAVESEWQQVRFSPSRFRGDEEDGVDIAQETLLSSSRPFSYGCLINCYEPLPAPNVTYFEAVIPATMDDLSVLPYVYSDGSLPIRDGFARVVVLLALRDIEDEELLTDYSFVAHYVQKPADK